MKPDMYVRIDAIGSAGLPAEAALRGFMLALTELGVMQALALIHGTERGYRRYVEAGGAVRFTSYGDAFVPVDTRRGRVAGRYNWHVTENVTRADMRVGRGSFLGPDTNRRLRWWDLGLECGHTVQRNVRYRPLAEGNPGRDRRLAEDALPPVKRARCDECSLAVRESGTRSRRERLVSSLDSGQATP